jgi:thiamine biosynthesis lipoprotein
MFKIFKSLVLVALCFALSACFKEPLYHSQSYVFGTLVDISIAGESDERASMLANHVMQEFQNLHNRLHAWKATVANQPSELGELNAAFSNEKTPLNIRPDLAQMLLEIRTLSEKSEGLFNPGIGQLIGLWGFQRDEFTAVTIDAPQIKALVKANPRMADIVVSNQSVYSNNSALKLDLGGYAKGYALDVAVAYLRQQGVKNALINIGGNVIALGQHGNKPWRVGIQHPRQPTAIATLDLADGWAIGTSGDYQRYFMLNGQRYCHIIDPRTGYPAQHMQSVTVLVPPQAANKSQAGVLSDVVTKPIFIAGATKSSRLAQAFGIQDFMLIDEHAHIIVSKQMAQKLNWVNADVKFTTLP